MMKDPKRKNMGNLGRSLYSRSSAKKRQYHRSIEHIWLPTHLS